MKDKRSSIKDYRAVKILSKAYMEEKEINSFRNEVATMFQLHHPNIMKLYHFYEDPKRYLLITDICKGGDLYECIKEKRLNAKEGAICLKQILSAVDLMHQLKIVHRDLKPENVLLEARGDVNQIKIIDFGTARFFNNSDLMTEKIGTFSYMAPEIFSSGGYDEKCDIWSIGVIAYVIMVGKFPIEEVDERKMVKQIEKWDPDTCKAFNDEEFRKIDPDAQDFIQRCLQRAENRQSAAELMQHKFIRLVTDNLKNEFNFERHQKKSERSNMLTDFALQALECFKNF